MICCEMSLNTFLDNLQILYHSLKLKNLTLAFWWRNFDFKMISA
jgi:hypothetical protein